MLLRLLLSIVIVGLTVSYVNGHMWYPTECCSGQDCFVIACDKIKQLGNGNFMYETYEFVKGSVMPSQDGDCHACLAGPEKNIPRCLFTSNLF